MSAPYISKKEQKLRADAPTWAPKKKEIKLVRIEMDMPDTITDKESFKIMSLVKKNKIDEVTMIIDRFTDDECEWILNRFTYKNYSLLDHARYRGHLDMYNYLISKGAKDFESPDGETGPPVGKPQISKRKTGSDWKRNQQVKSDGIIFDVKPLKKTENAWKKNETEDELEKLKIDLTKILNKLSMDNFPKLSEQISKLIVDTKEKLILVVEIMHNKPILQPIYGEMYSNLFKKLENNWRIDESCNLRQVLLNYCQKKYLEGEKISEKPDSFNDWSKSDQDYWEEISVDKAKEYMLNNIKLIGELYKVELLPIQIIIICMNELFQINGGNIGCLKEPDEKKIECSLNLLETIGKNISNETSERYIGKYINIVRNLSEFDEKLSSRIRFCCKDMVELFENNWVPRRQKDKPTTLALAKAEMYPE